MCQDFEVGYFHSFRDGVDFVFIDNPIYHACEHNIYGGSREVWIRYSDAHLVWLVMSSPIFHVFRLTQALLFLVTVAEIHTDDSYLFCRMC